MVRRDRGARQELASRFALPMVFVLLLVGFSAALPSTFFTTVNYETIAGQQVVAGILGLALLPALVAGDFDLSIGANMTLSSTLAIGLQTKSGVPWPVAVLAALAVGAIIGTINSALVVRLRMNSLITTLAAATVINGIVNWYTNGQTVFGQVAPFFTKLGRWTVLGGVPGYLLYLIVVGVILSLLLRRTVFGKFLFATGSNRAAAQLTGVDTQRVRIAAMVTTATLASLAGVIFAANVGSGQPGIGDNYLLPAFAAAYLGATAFTPGRFNVLGTIVGVYFLAVGVTGLQQAGAPFYASPIFTGGALILAVALASILRRHRQVSG